jgi:hypothetical protein
MEASHSAGAALERIVVQRKIVAASHSIRGGTKAISWTEVPLVDLPKLRVFRPHRGRWDFELYGICVRRELLQRRGAQPVIYGDETDWQELSADKRPYFQRRQTRPRGGRRPLDWTQEREWRHLGDLDLDSVGAEDAFLFVPSQEEAERLAEWSRWPVVVLETVY